MRTLTPLLRLSLRPQSLPRLLSRYNSTEAPPSGTLLSKLRTDLKTAMRAKDAPRLAVLRSILAEVTNAAKTTKPIQSDLEVLATLRRSISKAKTAIQEFEEAKRADLAEKEQNQVKVLEEYASQVKTVSVEEITEAVNMCVERLKSEGKVEMGKVMKAVFGEGGELENKSVERKDVADVVKKALAGPS